LATEPHFFDQGQGKPVVLLHGLMASTRVFDDVIELGRKEHRFLSLDLPHSGKSRDWAQMSPAAIAAKLKPWLDTKGVKKAIVFGHSFGGLVGLELAVQFPSMVERLVVASAPALGVNAQAKQLLHLPGAEEGAAMISRLPLWKPLVRSYMQWLFGDPAKLTDRHVEGYFQSLQNPGSWAGMLEATRSVSSYKLRSAAIIESKVPIEVIWGDRDRLVSLIDGERLAVAIEAGFTVLPGVGHCVPEEHPEAVMAAIRGTSVARKAKDRGRRDIDEGE
jgi:pimeloyl-ACP methyl ester carboxylesterase